MVRSSAGGASDHSLNAEETRRTLSTVHGVSRRIHPNNPPAHFFAPFSPIKSRTSRTAWAGVNACSQPPCCLLWCHDVEPEILVQIDEVAHELHELRGVTGEFDQPGLDRVLERQ